MVVTFEIEGPDKVSKEGPIDQEEILPEGSSDLTLKLYVLLGVRLVRVTECEVTKEGEPDSEE